ncbi:MAG: DeoR/GlpR transcriptional regulator [Clostridia bacterium]|nr:DeoR/GlpR transcriptional regulator [Clostridia bacterium]
MKDRLLLLKEFIDKNGKISLKELAGAFPEVSSMTLRRDLARLEENNDVIRIPGGAVSVDSFLREKEAQFSKRINYMTEEKVEIAEKASKLVEPNSCVFIDGGSTTTYFARALPDDNYYVLTNAVTIAETILTKEKPTVTLLGGDLKKHTFLTVGKTCVDFIDGINIQTAVMTSTGFVKDTGAFTCGSQSEAEIKQKVIEKADLVIMLLDSSKINKKTPYTFATTLDVDYIVVDKEFPADLRESMTSMGMKVF